MYISYRNSNMSEIERKKHNEEYIKNRLKTQKDYFDNMFKKIDENIILDNEQRKIILTDEDNLMIIAGAGAGKTTTICAKVNYLIEKQNIDDKEIIIISFTNKAVQELQERINIDFGHNVKISTFHKFGYEIIKNNTKNPPKIIQNTEQIITKYIKENIINDKKRLNKFIDLYINYFDIDEDIEIYNSIEKYNYHKNKQKYSTLKQKKEFITKKQQEQENKNISINNEYIDTKKETMIANFLYINNIIYKYKQSYPYYKNYKPSFTIYQDNKIYYIEYINSKDNNKYKYNKKLKKIKSIHRKYKTMLIEITTSDTIETLRKKLENKNIKPKRKTEIEIFNTLIKQDNELAYKKFINLCMTYINLLKERGYQTQDIKNIEQSKKREKTFIEFIQSAYINYQQELKKNNQIDFSDLINESTNIIKNKKQINMKYKYIIIDEYQDISDCRFQLIQNIANKIKCKIMVVGDDWQCIYSFASSNVNLFTNFKNMVEHCEMLKITKTYRNSQELIDIAGKFIQKNSNQIPKKLISTKTNKHPVIILKYKQGKIIEKLENAIEHIVNEYGTEKNILILGRYTFDKKKIIDNINIIDNQKQIIYNRYKNLKIEFMTVHASKGLGYDNVIIVNAQNDILGFPSKIKNDPILEKLIPQEKNIKYAEERRLFYVALTRTKNEVIILTPCNNSSLFIKEIKKYKNVQIKSNIFKIKK